MSQLRQRKWKVGPPLSEVAVMSLGGEILYNHSFMFNRENHVMNATFSVMQFPNLRRQSVISKENIYLLGKVVHDVMTCGKRRLNSVTQEFHFSFAIKKFPLNNALTNFRIGVQL